MLTLAAIARVETVVKSAAAATRLRRLIDRPPSALLAGEKIEVAAVLGLRHPIGVKPDKTASRLLRRLPLRTTLAELGVVDLEIQLAALGVELNPVAIANERQWSAGRGLG